jgi:N-acetylmuramoyl-L-alanine amidase
MSRFAGRIGSAFVIVALLSSGISRAQNTGYVFSNKPVAFSHLSNVAGPTAIGIDDPALRGLLRDLGAVLTWQPGERYVLVTTAQPQVISFSVGDRRFDVGPISAQAAFAPFLQGTEVYLPLDDLLRALYLAPVRDGGVTVLQPQLASIDVQGSGSQALLVARAGIPLHPRVVTDGPDRVVYEFDGVGSALSTRAFDVGGIHNVAIATSGSARDPKTLVTVTLEAGARHDGAHSNNGDFEVGFGGNGGAPPLVAVATVAPQPSASASETVPAPVASASGSPAASVASVSTVSVQATSDGSTITIAVGGSASYEWHRLREPDNRFWIDIKGATLAGPPLDETEADPIVSMRVRQIDPQTVRVALSFVGANSLAILPSVTGLQINVGHDEVADAPREGSGSVGAVVSANEPQALITPVPPDMYGQNPPGGASDWKFGPRGYVPTNPRLIVIDPGHGGGDPGTMRNGVAEKDLALDMAMRLRTILIARGWQVQMTRSDDHDVPATSQSAAEAEKMGYTTSAAGDLQARDDIANASGARLFISVHVNGYINSGPSGTTTYYSKPSDAAFARIMDRTLAQSLGTKDDGTVKSHLYVTLHANMPAILVETAFLSNPDDYAKLTSSDWRQKVAQSMADGIDAYTQSNPVSTASTGGER